MNNKQMEKRINRDVVNVKKDVSSLFDNGVTQVTRGFEKLTGEAKKLTGEAKDTISSTAASVGKDLGNGLKQYNAKADEFANNVPGHLGEKVSQYPWVAITIGLAIGILLGRWIKRS